MVRRAGQLDGRACLDRAAAAAKLRSGGDSGTLGHSAAGGGLAARRRFAAAAVIAASFTFATVFLARASIARADGAFPMSQSVLLPRDKPKTIAVGSTFGLIITEDDGASWQYTCERAESRNGRQYVLGAMPDDRVYAVTDTGVSMTPDMGCAWTIGSGDIGGIADLPFVLDIFPHPTQPKRALLIGSKTVPDIGPLGIYQSLDGGVTFKGPLYEAKAQETLSGVEVPFSAPETIYAAFYLLDNNGLRPRLVRSNDGGATWGAVMDLEPMLGQVLPFIATIDPTNPDHVFLRLSGRNAAGTPTDTVAITTDGGKSWTKPLTVDGGTLTGFLRRGDGTLLALGRVGDKVVGYLSSDGGKSFGTWPLTIHPRGLAERDGTLFAATDELLDGASLMSSQDGATWTPRLVFSGRQILGPRACVVSACHDDCVANVDLIPLAKNACAGGGSGGAGGGGGGGGTTPPPPQPRSSACDLGGQARSAHGIGGAGACATAAALLASRRRRKRPTRS